MAICPECRTEYPSTVKFCTRDGSELTESGEPGPELVCPQCGLVYRGSLYCSNDGSPLVPKALTEQ